MKTLRSRRLAVMALFFVLAQVLFQNCSPFELDSKLKGPTVADFASTGGGDLIPPTDKIDANCMVKSEYNACLFKKNPVAASGQAFAGSIASVDVDPFQVFGVKLTGILKTGKLENGTIRIETVQGIPVSTSSADLRFKAKNDGGHRYAQVSTYYWLNRAEEYLTARTGVFPAADKSIPVYVDDTISGWSSRSNSIHLRLHENGNPMAWGPELAVHFLGLASLHHAGGGKINDLGSGAANLHRDCGTKVNGCCKAAVGCARALSSGVGDYFAAMIFPEQPVVGETWANSTGGVGFCGLDRNLNAASTRTATAAYDACTPSGINGEVTSLGTVYASIWWEVRKKAQTAKAGSNREVDTLFMHHLAELTGTDNFQTALEKIKSVDKRLFNSSYTSFFQAEFQARGL